MAQIQQYQIIQPAEVRTGMVVRIHQKIREGSSKDAKERIQVFEGMVLTVHGKEPNRTMTVRKVSDGVGVEKIFPLNLPTLEKIEVVKQYKTHRKNMSVVVTSKKRLKEVPIRPARLKVAPAEQAPAAEDKNAATGSAAEPEHATETSAVEEAKAEAPAATADAPEAERANEEKQPA